MLNDKLQAGEFHFTVKSPLAYIFSMDFDLFINYAQSKFVFQFSCIVGIVAENHKRLVYLFHCITISIPLYQFSQMKPHTH